MRLAQCFPEAAADSSRKGKEVIALLTITDNLSLGLVKISVCELKIRKLILNLIPHCQLSLWEETRVPGENPRQSVDIYSTHENWVQHDGRYNQVIMKSIILSGMIPCDGKVKQEMSPSADVWLMLTSSSARVGEGGGGGLKPELQKVFNLPPCKISSFQIFRKIMLLKSFKIASYS